LGSETRMLLETAQAGALAVQLFGESIVEPAVRSYIRWEHDENLLGMPARRMLILLGH